MRDNGWILTRDCLTYLHMIYEYDSEYGYIEWKCEAWMPLPEPYKAESEE